MDEEDVSSKLFWFLGMAVSAQCLLIQIFLYIVLPSSRKLDQKMLTELTIARLANVVSEYLVMHAHTPYPAARDAIFTIYIQTDAALVCWMFVFTKNLYDKVVVVFTQKKINIVLLSVSIWIITLSIGLLGVLFLNMDDGYFSRFYEIYGIVKFVILGLNLLFFFRIFWVAITRNADRDIKALVRTCVVSFILVCITSLQVLLTDLTSYFGDNLETLNNIFCVANSYQVISITVIFIILSKPPNEATMKTIKSKLKAIIA